ncbi:MAG: bifunctional 4-hydroxy-2-oxoglutarate aldolase/2-dehydro-3-deoxy-phosphogluconate aldolase [Planctomycetota bacterium]|nr:bifunctional 4-hydroxy-2-oxoglutarate aldolase/2-dehydro-3-deoxy-phosphogluconate aldolase [Planctomycetota bacterium]MDG2083407.1 bifunctional 4-hydroxy-2-oxoglutarate aldolase/2-dehydro-3-deoxy-phosphogluconate aldolase [Planctomycetota bacterium]
MLPENSDPAEFVRFLGTEKASAILRTPHGDLALPAMESALRAGFRICEYTLTIPGAYELIRETASRYPEVVIGAGTVLNKEQAQKSISAGARFLVSPVVDIDLIRFAQESNVAIIPGCSTPTEMITAHRAGAPLVKLFPAPAGGPSWVQAVLGPLPELKIVPTSGVTQENAREFLKAGAHAIGFVAPLFQPQDIEEQNWDKIEARGKELLFTCQQVT